MGLPQGRKQFLVAVKQQGIADAGADGRQLPLARFEFEDLVEQGAVAIDVGGKFGGDLPGLRGFIPSAIDGGGVAGH